MVERGDVSRGTRGTRVEAKRNLNLNVFIGSINEGWMVESVGGRLMFWGFG
jgi:hypothetical protein